MSQSPDTPALKLLVLQHVASEHPGSFRDVMAARGCAWDAVELDEGEAIPAFDGYDALLVMGGPQDVWQEDKFPWLKAEKAAIRDWVEAGRPYLGICLGNQLLAEAFGGKVALMTAKPEVGMGTVRIVADDPLFKDMAETVTCFQWHAAEVVDLPDGAKLLATNPECRVQAQVLNGNAYGLQCHMELTTTTAGEWGTLPEYRAALERVKGEGALPGIQAEVDAQIGPLQAAAKTLFGNFLDIVEDFRKETPRTTTR